MRIEAATLLELLITLPAIPLALATDDVACNARQRLVAGVARDDVACNSHLSLGNNIARDDVACNTVTSLADAIARDVTN